MKVFHTHSAEETFQVAKDFAKSLKAGDVIAYKGGLGAGKTTFTRGLAQGLELLQPVSSPTFALVQEYSGTKYTLIHFDMYRITSFDDLESTGFFDYLNGENILAIEWSENITPELPQDTIFIALEQHPTEENSRTITIEGGAL